MAGRWDTWLGASWRSRAGARQRATVEATDFAGGTAEWIVSGEQLQQGECVEWKRGWRWREVAWVSEQLASPLPQAGALMDRGVQPKVADLVEARWQHVL